MSLRPIELTSCGVISQGSFTGGVEGTEPKTSSSVRLADLSDPFAPSALSNTFVSARRVIGSTFSSHTTFPRTSLDGSLFLISTNHHYFWLYG
uniref:Uncharacterized protein n=1 Tax=Arabidopsis thaliana TaxID=3702 RepID=Q8GW21_ARATH|nr:unknown protein [Arabidopsis thaliana]